MKKRLVRIGLIVWAISSEVMGWMGMPTPPLRIEDNKLKDPAGNDIVIHGWMQPTSSWFNGQGKWYRDPNNWTNVENVRGMLEYLNEVATVMSDTTPKYGRNHGWYATFVRVNTDGIGGWDAQRGLYDTAQFRGWLTNFIIPYANHLKTRGLYLVLSATGPINTPNNGTRNAGVVEQQRLITFWKMVAGFPGIKNADNITFELMNEPVEIESVPGNGQWGMGQSVYFEAFTKWMQPVIDAIRSTGANNVIWVPTLEWQGSPHQWAQFPFSGTNIGVAAHLYPAYGDVRDNWTKIQNLWNRQYKPAADRWPMIITEMFWTPYPDDYWNLVNGSTAGFGNNAKRLIDAQGNVSYIVGFIGDLLDEMQARPAQARLIEEREGAPAYFGWLPEYAKQLRISFGARSIPGRIEAEQYERMHGVQVESNASSYAERHIGYINGGDWTRYLIRVAQAGNYIVRFRLASEVNDANRVQIKNAAGTLLGTLTINPERTNGWQDWYVDSAEISLASGVQELVLEYTGSSYYLFNLDWIEIAPAPQRPVPVRDAAWPEGSLRLIHGSAGKILRVELSDDIAGELYLVNTRGQVVLRKQTRGNTQLYLGDHLKSGVYHAVLHAGSRRYVAKFSL